MNLDSRSRKFWKWFQQNEARLQQRCDEPTVWNEIDRHIDSLDSELTWELGPSNGKMYFAISPDLDLDVVSRAVAVLESTYQSEIWEFRLGRQRRPWSDVLEIARSTLGEKGEGEFNLEECVHVAFRVPDTDRYEVLFACQTLSGVDEDVRDEIGWILAVGLLGEMLVLQHVESVSLDPQLEPRFQTKAKPAAMLPLLFGLERSE